MLRYKEIKKDLMNMLESIGYKEKLPSMISLCESLETTKNTLSKALKELEAEHYVTIKNGCGVYKTSISGNIPLNVDENRRNWGLILISDKEELYQTLTSGIKEYGDKHGVNIVVASSNYDARYQGDFADRLVSMNVEGLIIVPVIKASYSSNLRLYSYLTKSKVPFIFACREVDGIKVPTLCPNYFHGGYIQARHLYEMGYRQIAYIAEERYRTSMDRCSGYVTFIAEKELGVNRDLIELNANNYEKLKTTIHKWLIVDKNVDAICCFSDRTALHVYQAVEELGLKVGVDVAIIGSDNSDLCDVPDVKLTSIDTQVYEMGIRLGEIFDAYIKGEWNYSYNKCMFLPKLIVRESTPNKRNK